MKWLSREDVRAALVVVWRAVVAVLLGLLVGNGGLGPQAVVPAVVASAP